MDETKQATLPFPAHSHMPRADAAAMDRFIADLLPTLRGYLDMATADEPEYRARPQSDRDAAGLAILIMRGVEILLAIDCVHYAHTLDQRIDAYAACILGRNIAKALGVPQASLDAADRHEDDE